MNKAILIGRTVYPMDDPVAWGKSFEKFNRRVGFTVISKRRHIRVSTVFLGINHGYDGIPMWFETMVFGSSLNQHQERYETYEQAEKGHAKWVARVRNSRLKRHKEFNVKKMLKRTRKIMKQYAR